MDGSSLAHWVGRIGIYNNRLSPKLLHGFDSHNMTVALNGTPTLTFDLTSEGFANALYILICTNINWSFSV